MKLCILENDVLDPEVAPLYHGYGAMFERLLKSAGATGEFIIFPMGQYPESFETFDAVLLTGSRADAFSDEPWVVALRQKVEQLLQNRKKLLGICFGHQLIGLCLGARVGRAPQGWGVGRLEYQSLAPEGQTLGLLASHQDQVLELPPEAMLWLTSEFCPVAAFSVQQHVWCIQPHPEFVEGYSAYLLGRQRNVLGASKYATALDSLKWGHDGGRIARAMVDFIESKS